MRKLLQIIVPAAAIMISVTSCDKTPTTTVPTIDTPDTTTPPTTGPTPVTPQTGSGFWGAMIALKMKYSFTNPQLPMPVTTESQIGIASFYDNNNGSGNLVDAGTVAVNSNNLEKQSNNSYTLTATTGLTPSTLNLGSSVKWDVSGGNGIPVISYSHTGTFPDYSGTLPTSISKSSAFEIDLGSKVTGADSVYVVIVTSSKTIIKAFGGNPAPAKATISASDLSGLPTVSDNTAYLEIVPFTYTTSATSGKDFVYIKETAIVSSVNIN